MALDLQDQEELENAKRAWQQWGRWLFLLVFAVSAVYFGNSYWQQRKTAHAENAAEILNMQYLPKHAAGDRAGALTALQTLQNGYAGTAAAAQATLTTAHTAFSEKNYGEAEKHLVWLNAQKNPPLIRALAAERLAVVYLQQKKYDDALAALNIKTEPELTARLEETKGDIYLAQGKKDEAGKAFQAALDSLPQNSAAREFIEAKMRL